MMMRGGEVEQGAHIARSSVRLSVSIPSTLVRLSVHLSVGPRARSIAVVMVLRTSAGETRGLGISHHVPSCTADTCGRVRVVGCVWSGACKSA